MRSRLGQVRPLANLGDEGVRLDHLLGPACLVVARCEPVQAVLVRVESETLALEGLPCAAGAETGKGETVESEREALA
jgi:hypothetical protein